MNSTRLVFSVTWLLNYLENSETADAIAGDLLEQFRQGRSAGWYCRQVLTAVLIGAWNDLWSHKLLALRAIVVGWVFESALWMSWLFLESHNASVHRLFQWQGIDWKILPIVLGVNFLTGFILARCYRRHKTAMVLVYCVFVDLYLLCQLSPLLPMQFVDSLDQPRFRPYLMFNLSTLVVTTVGLVLGGFVVGPRSVRANLDASGGR